MSKHSQRTGGQCQRTHQAQNKVTQLGMVLACYDRGKSGGKYSRYYMSVGRPFVPF